MGPWLGGLVGRNFIRCTRKGMLMKCDTCKQESDVVLRVVIAKDYNRALARPIYNCADCFEKKEQVKAQKSAGTQGSK